MANGGGAIVFGLLCLLVGFVIASMSGHAGASAGTAVVVAFLVQAVGTILVGAGSATLAGVTGGVGP